MKRKGFTTELDFDAKMQELETKRRTLNAVRAVYENVIGQMQYHAMECHSPDEDHDEYWYSVPNPENEDDWYNMEMLAKYEIYQRVLEYLTELV